MTDNGDDRNLPRWVADFNQKLPCTMIRPIPIDIEIKTQHKHNLLKCEMIWFIENESGQTVSLIGINNIDYKSSHAEMFIVSENGNEKYLSIGINNVYEYCFYSHNLNRLHARIEENNPLVDIISDAGFKHEASLKNHKYSNGRYNNVYWFGLLKSDKVENQNE